ncbi:hypothetical protein [Hymenobacter metallilatus]|uniref:Uncharacterized protein n=1 Tax=Hymenobacter metallilatus TaxID=2493666 RepID=A0A428IYV8_9BACT|nr:hypothetical protein [Hymenobacter metallilatus]RSK24507.1 hypothetical protein EI290_19340 [Hymenobacter metallilatus]
MMHAQVQSIRLTDFNYNPDYVPTEEVPITYQLQALNRVPEDGETLEITVGIRYLEPDSANFLLSATCRTVYKMMGMTRLKHPETGRPVVDVAEVLLQQLSVEAVAHARALVAAHTAGTWFEQYHVSLGGALESLIKVPPLEAEAPNKHPETE